MMLRAAAIRRTLWAHRGACALALVITCLGTAPAGAAPPHPGGRTVLPGRPGPSVRQYKLDDELLSRTQANPQRTTRVIVELAPGAQLPASFKRLSRRLLGIINGEVLDVPNGLLKQLAGQPGVFRLHYDRPTQAHNYRTGVTIGSRAAEAVFGLTGAGVGVAVIDSGITNWHDDLTGGYDYHTFPYGNQRVMRFVDFVNGRSFPYDDNGHGTHVAGIIAGNGFDSNGRMAGVAPRARLVSLKVLDANGAGTISHIIAALDWVVANRAQYNIRVVNLSAGAAVRESYRTDPLTLAAKRVVDAGIVVVTAAGNVGKNANGKPQYGGITAPANAPWVLTVGASSTMGTVTRRDDTVASFSSRGPTYLDWSAKPDLVAPGAGTVSLSDPGGTFYSTKAQYLVSGTGSTAATKPYLVLSGTSMAAPVVAGTVALMLQANPALTPNAVKAILEYTAQTYAGYDPLTQGAGFLNAYGAARLSMFFRFATPGAKVPTQSFWSKHVLWGNQMLSGGVILPGANAWTNDVVWGAAKTSAGDNIVWGETCADCDNIVWGETDGDNIVWGDAVDGDNIVWGENGGDADNIVWGEDCGGSDCDNIVWGEVGPDNQIWGTALPGDNIVWGESDADNIVWGESDDDNIVWGESDGDNIVWGESDGDNIVWGESDGDNIVWGESGSDNIVWGEVGGDNIVWGETFTSGIVWKMSGDRLCWGTVASGRITWDYSYSLPGLWLKLAVTAPADQIVFGLGTTTGGAGSF